MHRGLTASAASISTVSLELFDSVETSMHYEFNPWWRPLYHYAGVGWQPQPGIEKTQELLDIDPKADAARIEQ